MNQTSSPTTITAVDRAVARGRSEAVRKHVVSMLKEVPGLFVNDTSGQSAWVNWDGRGYIGYWVNGGTVVGGTREKPVGSGYATVTWLDGSDDEREGPDPQRIILDVSGIPADAVGDGSVLGLMAINALQADRMAHR